MTMAEKLSIHKEIEEADMMHREAWRRAFTDAINLALDAYFRHEVKLEDLDKYTTEVYNELTA